MFCRRRLCLFLPLINHYKAISFTSTLHSENTQFLLLTVRSFSSNPIDKHSFTISYLVNSCGLSSDSAKSVSNYVLFDSPNNPDSVLSLFRNHGFTDHQISKVVRRRPGLLQFDADKIILPKLQFLLSIGLSSNDLSTLVTKNPTFLARSLNQFLIPFYDILKIFLSDDDVLKAFKGTTFKTLRNLNCLNANLSTLREIGMPPSTISSFLMRRIAALFRDTKKFKKAVKEVVEMGFDPVLFTFVAAVTAKIKLSETSWKCKIEAFEKWGILEDEILEAFKKHPQCMLLSEESINSKMRFLVSKIRWQPADVLQQPVVISFSLEKRIMPRCLIVKILQMKGLIKTKMSLLSIINTSDKYFLNKYVDKYKEQVPNLLDVFQGKMNFEDQGLGFDEICAASPVQYSRE